MEKQLKQLNKAYSKKVKLLNKNFTKDATTGLSIFVEQLKHLRDTLIIKSASNISNDIEVRIASIITAVTEFEAYQKSEEKAKKIFHWNNFWEFVKIGMEDWLILNDTI